MVLTASRPVTASVRPAEGNIEIVYSEPVEVKPPQGRGDDGILDRWSVRGIRTVVVETGPGFRRLESFHLKNPSRLVLDLEGERSARSASSRGRPAAIKPEFVVVIDPGHGGAEVGAVGPTGLEEKEVALDLARRLKGAIQTDPTVGVVLTRDEDRVVSLDERTSVANHNRADLFLSIHLNASRGRRAAGSETYYLSDDATDDDARTVAALENRAYQPVQPFRNEQGEYEPGLERILWDLAQNQHLARSARLAESVQSELDALAGTKNRGVRQAPFRVLQGATMPAILVEVGFLSNPEEEGRLRTDEYRDRIVEAIARAIAGFRRVGEGMP
jgi:N-acetylmuramoyl-L-alanine amidase